MLGTVAFMEEGPRRFVFTAANLTKAFGVRSSCTHRVLPFLYQRSTSLLHDPSGESLERDFANWRLVFGEVTGRDPADPRWIATKQFTDYAVRLGVREDGLCPSRLLFAVHSYYSLLVKLIMRFCLEPHDLGMSWKDASDDAVATYMAGLDAEATYASFGVRGVLEGDGFGWCQHIWTDDGIPVARVLLQTMDTCGTTGGKHEPTAGGDILKALYHALAPRVIRHQLGEYYTPDWLVEHLLDRVGYQGQPDARLLDPACGSGSFLIPAIQRLRREDRSLTSILENIAGIDINPLAVLAARANYLLAIRDLLLPADDAIELPVYLADSIVSPQESRDLFSPPPATRQPPAKRFDFIVGNPPWVGWESLPEDYRQHLKPLWIRYGLFPHSGMSTILGQGKKDLSMLMSYAVSDRWLKPGGRLGFLITQSVFKNAGAGRAFRRFRLGGKADVPLRVEYVDDMSDFQPFEEASTRTALFVWTKGQTTDYPVPYEIWQKTTPGNKISQVATLTDVADMTRRLEMRAEPVAADDAGSPWLTVHSGLHPVVRRLLGASDYRAHEGINTGGANGIYWLEVLEDRGDGLLRVRNLTEGAKRKILQVEAVLEPDLIYPLLRGREVRRWQADSAARILLVQDVERRRGIDVESLQRRWPRTWEYLRQFEQPLRARAAFRRYFQRKRGGRAADTAPFYSMFDVGTYTLAPFKVVWHRMVTPVEAAVVGSSDGKPVMPQETHAFVSCGSADEAAYLCGMLNSTVFNFAAYSYSQTGGKSFASPHILEHIRIPVFDPDDGQQRQVAKLAAGLQRDLAKLHPDQRREAEQELDIASATVWGLPDEERELLLEEYRRLTKADLGALVDSQD